MNVVVTGSTSFLGAALIRKLLGRGCRVYAVVRPGSRNLAALTEAAGKEGFGYLTIIELELEKLDNIAGMIGEPCHIFFHFGWDGSGSHNRMKADVQHKNVEDGLKALRGARNLGCSRFVFSGSQAEYGVYRTAMREDMECRPVSEYGRAKAEFGRRAGELVRFWAAEDGFAMEYIHARIFSVYGPGDHPWSLVNSCLDTFLKGEKMELGACTQQWNYLYIEDLVKGLIALAFSEGTGGHIDGPGAGVYNLAGGMESTRPLREYVEIMHHLCGGRGSCVYGKLPPNAEGPANLIPDIEKIREKTGWKPEISFEEGIKRMLEIKERKNREKHCILCGRQMNGTKLMELAGMPASAQDIPDESRIKEDRGITLCLCQCPKCGLVQFDCEPVEYYRDVIRSGGYSTTMVNLRAGQYRHLIDTYGLEGKKFLEVGCGRGEFLKVLTGFPVEAYGVEHRQSLVDGAVKDGLRVVKGFTESPDTVLGDNGPYDVFLSFNFLEHQPEPGVMLDCIRNNLTEDGMGLITVPSLEYILKYNGYYELLRDHIAYYTFDTLRYLMESNGFQVLEEEMVNRDTLSVIVRRQRELPRGSSKAEPVDISGLTASVTDIRGQMEQLRDRLEKEGKSLAVWGASHQGFTLAATTVLKDCARYMIDSAPFKQGRFAPASHLPIVPPDHWYREPADVILIVAPGYTEEIADSIRSRFGTDVEIMALRSDRVEELS
ncbi:MAG: NAD-dependent epimerase/dehydratase family protein [Hungatella sp.]|nr:NAD-dependent epimerase/dehydratase family protein [Hungatella sp.]